MSPKPDRLKGALASPLTRTLLGAGLILLACIAAYAPVLHGQFLWDDTYLVGANPFFKSPRFVMEVFRHWLFLDSFSLYYRPVQNLSYIVDYAIWNRDAFGYHLSNILFHAASGVLLMLVLRRCLRQLSGGGEKKTSPAFIDAAAFLCALLWAVHPVHNAAVAYVAGRADSIAMMFALAGWLLFVNQPGGWKSIASTAAGALCILVALCAKEIAFIWIALFTLYLFGFERSLPLRAKLRTVGALLAAFACYLVLRHLPGTRVAQQGLAYPPFADRIILMLRALGDYTSLIFYPANLHMERSVWSPETYRGFDSWQAALRAEYLSLVGLGTIAAFALACWSRLPGRAVRVLGVCWFVLGFLPISNLFPLNAQVAEHWIYMASAGYILMLAGWVAAIPRDFQRKLVAIAPLAVIALGVRTAYRAADWADPETFFRQTIASGGFPERVSLNLAEVLEAKGRVTEAEQVLRKTVADFPDYPTARIKLGMNLLKQNRKDEAQRYLVMNGAMADKVAATTPQSWHAALDLASMRYGAHDTDGALATLDAAVQRYPDVWDLLEYRAEILQVAKGPQAALPAVQDYAARNWWHMQSHLILARLLAASEDLPGALATCHEAATLDIHSPAPYEQAARASVQAGQYQQALQEQVQAIDRGGDEHAQYMMLAAILDQLHQPKEAMAAMQRASLKVEN